MTRQQIRRKARQDRMAEKVRRQTAILNGAGVGIATACCILPILAICGYGVLETLWKTAAYSALPGSIVTVISYIRDKVCDTIL